MKGEVKRGEGEVMGLSLHVIVRGCMYVCVRLRMRMLVRVHVRVRIACECTVSCVRV